MNRMWQKSKLLKILSLLSCSCDPFTLGEASHQVMGALSQPVERPMGLRLPTNNQQQLASLGSQSLGKQILQPPPQAFRQLLPWPTSSLQLHVIPWAWTTQLSCSPIPDNRDCEIINVDYCFKRLNFGVIYYKAIDNQYKRSQTTNFCTLFPKKLLYETEKRKQDLAGKM